MIMKESNNLELWVSKYYKQHKSINLHVPKKKENWESDKTFEYIPVDVAFQSVQHSEACLLGLTLLHSAQQNLWRFSDFRHESFMYVRACCAKNDILGLSTLNSCEETCFCNCYFDFIIYLKYKIECRKQQNQVLHTNHV